MTAGPLFSITVELAGTDGNAYAVLGRVRRALKDHGIPADQIARYIDDATSGDYQHLLATTMRYVQVV